ncbi:MAG TPA: hypothetical protein VMD58_10890 [Acidobacteriaceae bacterium]|nr:hypothetical protein [Acidobacteriaceae bacterium]
MRANKVAHYESILQVLGETGCPFCRFMKNYQTALMQDPAQKNVHHLCNFHTWGLAATQRASSAARLFLALLDKPEEAAGTSPCDICVLLGLEEEQRIREFIGCLHHKLVVNWMRSQSVLCLGHGTRLKQGMPPATAAVIDSIMERYRKQLAEELSQLQHIYEPAETKWGTLGHAAEFLASQRGLRP